MVQWYRTRGQCRTRGSIPGPGEDPTSLGATKPGSPLKSCHHLLSRHRAPSILSPSPPPRAPRKQASESTRLSSGECRASPECHLQLQVPARPLELICPSRALLCTAPYPSEPSWAEHPDQPSLETDFLRRGQRAASPARAATETHRVYAYPHPAQCWIALHRSAFLPVPQGPHLTNTPSLHTHADLCSGCRVPEAEHGNRKELWRWATKKEKKESDSADTIKRSHPLSPDRQCTRVSPGKREHWRSVPTHPNGHSTFLAPHKKALCEEVLQAARGVEG